MKILKLGKYIKIFFKYTQLITINKFIELNKRSSNIKSFYVQAFICKVINPYR